MNNEDIKVIKERLSKIESLCTDDCINKSIVIQPLKYAIENLIKGYKDLEEKINKLEILKTKLLKEFECANEGFMKKQIPTSVVDGTIAQEVGWILQEIDDILQEGDTNETKM